MEGTTISHAVSGQLTETEFNRVRSLVASHTGIAMTEAKRDLLHNRLQKRLRARGFASFGDYCALLEGGDAEEIEQFVNSVTTNLTGFFREPHHFERLSEKVMPELTANQGGRIRIWSAGCSTGEEPYSIAMTVTESVPKWRQLDVKILATDLDSQVLSTAAQGVYSLERIEQIKESRHQRWLNKGTGINEGSVRVTPELKALITFRQLNLMHAWPMRGPIDVIFCRNVVIYFDKETQRRLFDRFADLMRVGGYLFIGHSESLFNVTDRFRLLGKTIYQRVD